MYPGCLYLRSLSMGRDCSVNCGTKERLDQKKTVKLNPERPDRSPQARPNNTADGYREFTGGVLRERRGRSGTCRLVACQCFKSIFTTYWRRLHIPNCQRTRRRYQLAPPALPHRTPFQQACTGPRERIFEVIGTDPQGIAEAAGPLGNDVLAEDDGRTLLLHRGQYHDLGFLQVAVAVEAPQHHPPADVVGSQPRQIDGRPYGERLAAGHRARRRGAACFDEPPPGPRLAELRRSARPFSHG